MSPLYTVAIDLGKSKHVASLVEIASTKVLQLIPIPVTQIGFEQFEATLRTLSPHPTDFIVGCEATGHYGETLLRRLNHQGYPIVRLNPAQVAQFRRGLGRRAKTDALDAQAMAQQLALKSWSYEVPISATTQQLQRLTRLRLEFVTEQSRWINRVHALLNQMCPELERLLKDLVSPTALALLTHFPARLLLANAPLETLTQIVRQASHGIKREPFAQQLKAIALTSVGLDDPWLETELRLVVHQLKMLTDSITMMENQIEDLTAQVLAEYSARLGLKQPLTRHAFPCGQALTIGTLLAEIGDIERFKSLKHLVSYFGWCPQTQESGQSHVAHPKISHRGNRFARRILWMMAIAAVRWVDEYRTYFKARIKAGKNKMKTLVAVGRKLLGVIYAVLRTGHGYERDRFKGQFCDMAS
jgi:transposase